MSKQTKRRRNKTKKRRNKRNKTKKYYKRNKTNLREFIKGKGYEQQKPFKIIVDNNNHKQFGNIIPGLREM